MESSIDQAPYVQVSVDGMVAGVSDEIGAEHQDSTDEKKAGDRIHVEHGVQEKQSKREDHCIEQGMREIVTPVVKCLNKLSRENRISVWLLAYIALATTWPLVGSAVSLFLKRRRLQPLLS